MPRRRSVQQQQHRGGGGGGGYNNGGGDADELNIPLDSTSVIRRLVYSDQDSSRLQLRRVDTIAATAGNDVSPSSSIDSDDLMFEEEDIGGGYVDGTKMRMMSSSNYGRGGSGSMDRFSYSGSGYRGRGGRQPYIPQSIEEYRALDSNDEGDSSTGEVEAATNQRTEEARPSFVDVEDDSFCSFLDNFCT